MNAQHLFFLSEAHEGRAPRAVTSRKSTGAACTGSHNSQSQLQQPNARLASMPDARLAALDHETTILTRLSLSLWSLRNQRKSLDGDRSASIGCWDGPLSCGGQAKSGCGLSCGVDGLQLAGLQQASARNVNWEHTENPQRIFPTSSDFQEAPRTKCVSPPIMKCHEPPPGQRPCSRLTWRTHGVARVTVRWEARQWRVCDVMSEEVEVLGRAKGWEGGLRGSIGG